MLSSLRQAYFIGILGGQAGQEESPDSAGHDAG